jgi:citrate lyase subunit beta/citryl-CoA lyase
MLHPRRSVLYVPASNTKALAKVATLSCDAIIVDLEDAVAPADKVQARSNLEAWFSEGGPGDARVMIRINALSTEWGSDDLALAGRLEPKGIVLPKVDTPRDILNAADALDDNGVGETTGLWAMIETPRAVLNIGPLAELGRDPGARLEAFVVGTNDLARDTGVSMKPDRRWLTPWLMQIVLAARAGGICVLDGVYNDFRDAEGFARECAEAAAMGFDGKTLIHPTQIEAANAAFSPSAEALAEAEAIVAAFARPENAGKGVIQVGGRMTEILHLRQAEDLIRRSGALQSRHEKDR